ncbi:MAG: RagB/SusD family nutrient uptake outer membrane protein [Rikenellaceae bacterium]|nr:RagB/SusD family nutrient uptake outer membrane protein [Rikenellaceae bacterium]
MNKILKISTLALFASVAMTGCIKETEPNSVVTAESVAQSSTAVQAMVNAIPVAEALPYSVFGSGNNQGFDFGLPGIMCATDSATGDVVQTTGDSNSGYNWFWFWDVGTSLNSTQSRSQFTWYCYWNFVKSCNDIIAVIGAEPETDEMKAYLAYAKANRAALYLDMARSFDPLENKYTNVSEVKGLTVPKITETTTEAEARNNPRLTRDEMFEFIFQDLDDAEALLTNNSHRGGKDVPSLAVVYGLKARAYLWLGGFDKSNYAQAASYARKAIDESGATILTEAQWLDPKTGFNTPNNSWLWYLPQSAEGITNLVNFVAWRGAEASWGYASLVQQGVHVNFYNRIADTDWRKRAFLGPDPEAWWAENKDICNINIEDEDWEGYFAPYASVKFRPANGEILNYNVGNVTSICMMRVEEMLLIEAEATAYSDPAKAADMITAFATTRDAAFVKPVATTEAVVDATMWQKRVELWGEGVVFYDFKRLNYGKETGYEGTNVSTDSRINTDGRAPWWNFVIPEKEVLQNEALKGKNNPEPCDIVKTWVPTEE